MYIKPQMSCDFGKKILLVAKLVYFENKFCKKEQFSGLPKRFECEGSNHR